MKILIVESPGKVKKIQGFLGSEFKVLASVGHVRDLPQGEIGVDPPKFEPKYVPTDRGKEVLGKLAATVKNASTVYLATDPDREGEAIAWHLKDALRIKEALRVTYTEITEKAVKSAVAAPRQINMALVAAQETRRILDRLVGYMVSPALADRLGRPKLSAGRVQSPAVRLVVDREREIRAFKVVAHYGVEMVFDSMDNITDGWKAIWQPKDGWLSDGQEYILDRTMAEQVAALRTLKVLDCQESGSKSSPPPPFITSTLQQAASAALKINPKTTMSLAQKLYEEGHITYMRTDSPNLSEEAIAEIRSWAAQHDYPLPPSPRTWKSKDGAQEAHEAIRPTHIEVEVAGETEDQQSLYKLIRLRAIASQLEDALFAIRLITLEGDVSGKAARFEAKGRTLIRPGWKALMSSDQTEEDENEPDNNVPKQQPGQTATARESKVVDKKTKPPSRYTEASLIRELEKQGIGRPSTYAAILDNITSRGYLRLEKRFMVPEVLGEQVIDALSGRFGFLDYDYTRMIEEDLDKIAEGKGKQTYLAVVSTVHTQLTRDLEGFGGLGHPCPDCGKPLRHRVKDGKAGYDFWGCSGYPDCNVSFEDDGGKPGAKREKKEQQTSEFRCPKCQRPLIRRTGTGKNGKPYDLFGCSGFPKKCKESFNAKEGKPDFKESN